MRFRKMKLAACLLSVATAVSAVPTYAVEDLFVSGPDEVAVEEAYFPEETGDVLTEAVGMDEVDLFSDADVYVPEEAPVYDVIEDIIPFDAAVGEEAAATYKVVDVSTILFHYNEVEDKKENPVADLVVDYEVITYKADSDEEVSRETKHATAEIAESRPASCLKPAQVLLKVVIAEDGAVEGNGTYFSSTINPDTGKAENQYFTAKDASTDTGLSKPLGHDWVRYEEVTKASTCADGGNGVKHVVIRCSRGEDCDECEDEEGLGGFGKIYASGDGVTAYDDELALNGVDTADYEADLDLAEHQFGEWKTRYAVDPDKEDPNLDITDSTKAPTKDNLTNPARPGYYIVEKYRVCEICDAEEVAENPEHLVIQADLEGEKLYSINSEGLVDADDIELDKNTKKPVDADYEFELEDCTKDGKYYVAHKKDGEIIIVVTDEGEEVEYIEKDPIIVPAGHYKTQTIFVQDASSDAKIEETKIVNEDLYKLIYDDDENIVGIKGSLLCKDLTYYEVEECIAAGHPADQTPYIKKSEAKTAPAMGQHVLTVNAKNVYDDLADYDASKADAEAYEDYEAYVEDHKGYTDITFGASTADCENDGTAEITYKCGVCGQNVHLITVKTKALGHVANKYPEEVAGTRVEPTCLSDGSVELVVKCSVCGKELTHQTMKLTKLDHVLGDNVEFEFVGDVIVDNAESPRGMLTAWEETVANGDTSVPYHIDDTNYEDSLETGVVVKAFRRCKLCGIYTEAMDNTPFVDDKQESGDYEISFTYSNVSLYPNSCNPGEGTIDLTATIKKEGKTVGNPLTQTYNYYTSKTNYTQGNKHKWGEDKEEIVTPATETTAGLKKIISKCTVCGKETIRTEVIPPIAHVHNMTHVEAKVATCVDDGNVEYYFCDGDSCKGKFYADEAGTTEIPEAQIIIPATGIHELEAVEAKDATCLEAGNIAYWQCKHCGKIFSDAEGTTEIEEAATIVAALGHDLQKVEAKEATTEEEGNIEYWVCSRCGEYFADEAGTQPIEDKTSVIIPKIEEVEPTVTPTPIPEEPTVTPTPIPEEPTVTPTPTPEPIAKPSTAPKISTVAKATSIKVTVTGEVEGADKYMVRYRTPEGTYTYETFTGTTYTITGLARGERYLVSVRGGNDGGWGPYSTNSKRFTQLTSRAYKAAKNQITVKFTCAKATRFEVRYSLNKNMTNYTTVSAEGNGAAVAVIKGLKSGTTYYLRVRPFFGNYVGRFGQVFAVTTK